MQRRRWGFVFQSLALFLALVALRWQVMLDMRLDWRHALSSGVGLGLVYDAAAVLLVAGAAYFVTGLLWLPLAVTGIFFASGVWLANLANTLYFRFFAAPLEWWTVRLHWRDIFEVYGSAGRLGMAPALALSALLALSACGAWGRRRLGKHSLGARVGLTLLGASLITVALLVRQSPVWTQAVLVGGQHRGSIVSSQTIFRWYYDARAGEAGGGNLRAPREAKADAAAWLARYRDGERGIAPRDAAYAAAPDAAWPLHAPFAPAPAASRALRRALGLPQDKPLSVIVLFVESLRGFEVFHPQIGPIVFAGLRAQIDAGAVAFTQAYSSSVTAGQTVRGQFSTLCSMLPDSAGPATYIAYPTVRARCLPQLLKEHGYRTAWINAYRTTFHNKGVFESLHGTDEFYDEAFFRARGITQRVGDWGLADGPVLDESLKLLEELHAKGPFFANLLTISTHHPFAAVKEGPLPSELDDALKGQLDYRGYLSRFRYADGALARFIAGFRKSRLADDTLLVVLGDHSTQVRPHLPLGPGQDIEINYRIPILFFAKGLHGARRVSAPIHQIDVAPTIAEVLGLAGEVSWLGRGVLGTDHEAIAGRQGSAFVYGDDTFFSYRMGPKLCHAEAGEGAPRCYRLKPGEDLLYSSGVEPGREDLEASHFFRSVIRANGEAIAYNLLVPPQK